MFNTSQVNISKRIDFFKKILRILGVMITILAMFFLVDRFWHHASELRPIELGWGTLLSIGGGIVFYVGSLGISAYILKALLKVGNVVISFSQALVIFGISQIGKYLPGNMFHYVFQLMAGQQLGIPPGELALSIGVNTIILGCSVGMIASLGLVRNRHIMHRFIEQQQYFQDFQTIPAVFGVSCGVVLLIIIVIFFLRRQRWFRKIPGYFHPRRLALPVMLYILVFIGYGVLHVILLKYVFRVILGIEWYQFTFGFSIAWLLGFITPGAPGGIGIRETIFVILFESVMNTALALELALLLRIITCFGDFVAFGAAYGVMKFLHMPIKNSHF